MRTIHQLDRLGDALRREGPGRACTHAAPCTHVCFQFKTFSFCVVLHSCHGNLCFCTVKLLRLFCWLLVVQSPKPLLLGPFPFWFGLFLLLKERFIITSRYVWRILECLRCAVQTWPAVSALGLPQLHKTKQVCVFCCLLCLTNFYVYIYIYLSILCPT